MARYRAGIVGLSWIAADPVPPAPHPVLGTGTPYSHASAYAAVPPVEVVAGCDVKPELCEAFLETWRPLWPNLRTYSDYREMLAAERLDVLSVVTPDHLHAPIVLDGVAAGVKAIFGEKPLATSLADADAMLAAVRERGVVMAVNHTRRWMPSYVAARELVRAGKIGELAQVSVHFGGPRAMLFRNHSHFLDLICFFAEADPEWVVAELEPGFEDYGTEYRGDGGRDPAKEPGVNAYIAFRNGVRAFLSGWKRGVPEVSVDLIGAAGHIHADDGAAVLIRSGEDGQAQVPVTPRVMLAGMHAAVVDLIAALETGRPTQSPPEEARKTVSLMTAILKSQAQGNVPVRVR
jgi:predicted dehydrogenase